MDRLAALAAAKGISVAPLANAWVLAQGEDTVPIPGTERRRWLDENNVALDIEWSAEDVGELEAALSRRRARNATPRLR